MDFDNLQLQQVSVSDIINLSQDKRLLADRELERGNRSNYAFLLHQSEELHALAELLVYHSTYNTTKIPLSRYFKDKVRKSLTLSTDLFTEDAKQLKLDLKRANVTNVEALPEKQVDEKAQEKIDKGILSLPEKFKEFNLSPLDLQTQILTRKKTKNNEIPEMVSTLRTSICQLIAQGKREEAAYLAQNIILRWTDNSLSKAHKFVTAVKEQFNVKEPPKNPRPLHNTNYFGKQAVEEGKTTPDEGKWIYAEYRVHLESSEGQQKGFLIRKPGSIDFLDKNGNFACHVPDIIKYRLATKSEVERLIEEFPPF